MGLTRLVRSIVFALVGTGATCTPRPFEIGRDEAVARARAEARFEPVSVGAVRATEEGRSVWRVTLKGPPLSPDHPLLYESLVVVIDRRTGAVVSLARP